MDNELAVAAAAALVGGRFATLDETLQSSLYKAAPRALVESAVEKLQSDPSAVKNCVTDESIRKGARVRERPDEPCAESHRRRRRTSDSSAGARGVRRSTMSLSASTAAISKTRRGSMLSMRS